MSDTTDSYILLIRCLNGLNIPYYIGGSVGSSHYGRFRTTQDTDLVADLREEHVQPLYQRLEIQYYVSEDAIRQAVGEKSSFNAIHLKTSLKVDVFVLKDHPYDQEAFLRRRAVVSDPQDGEKFYFATAEDIVLHKLVWFRLGGEVSERQWDDVLGVIQVQGQVLDRDYMSGWAEQLGIADLFQQLLQEAE